MYNRYIPQPDGSFRRRSVPDPTASQTSRQTPRQPSRPAPPKQEAPPPCPQPQPSRPQPRPPRPEYSAGSFLKNLLPRDLCTEDLIVVLLLLLMAGDNPQEKSNALLTMALYLLM